MIVIHRKLDLIIIDSSFYILGCLKPHIDTPNPKPSHPSSLMINVDHKGVALPIVNVDHREVTTLNLNDTKEGFLSRIFTIFFW
jgi:hypothetical protein